MARSGTSFHVMSKPTGALCNLDCTYCFFLKKAELYPGSAFRMSDEVLEAYIGQLADGHQRGEVTVAWQGGEPTIMGLDFFRRAAQIEQRYRRSGMQFVHTMQTNGTLLDDEWCAFFKEQNYLIGISIDGPRDVHDAYRVDKGGRGTFDKVMRGLRLLQKHGVEYNVLVTVNAANGSRPLEVYRFLRDELGATWIQFIPVVERETRVDGTIGVSERSVGAEQWGAFLTAVFDEWVYHDVGRVFVQTFEAAARNWVGVPSGVCVFSPTCGRAVALEHTGDLYACDHFVDPAYKLGNIMETTMIDLIESDIQRTFGSDKLDTLPQYCLDCDVRFACHGECPKNRFIDAPDGSPGLNYLCAGYKTFFHHIDRPMRLIAALVRERRPADEIMPLLASEIARAGRNEPCPCGSGKKTKRCHGAEHIVA